MRIGLSFDLKEDVHGRGGNIPDDAYEEYDCPATIDFIAAALRTGGNEIIRLGGGREFLEAILHEKVDFVFNISEGRGTYRSREAQVPSVLEMLDIPYSGSDPACLAISLDKPLTKKLAVTAGVATPTWRVICSLKELNTLSSGKISFPVIVKPAFEGSSKGVRLNSIAHNEAQVIQITREILELYNQPVMIEGFVDGDEVTVGLIGNNPPKIVGIMRILPRKKTDYFVYSLEVKRDWRQLVDYECPARFDKKTIDTISDFSMEIFNTLECRDFARIDFRIGNDGIPYFIEINPLPGLGDYSDLIIMAAKMGWAHDEVIKAVFNAAIGRYPLCVQK
jgi:D-alanine-D-alanine ligase